MSILKKLPGPLLVFLGAVCLSFGGLIERDILRLEAGLCLSGNEFSENMDIKYNELDMNFLINKRRRKDGTYLLE